jgi:hypothetical protein
VKAASAVFFNVFIHIEVIYREYCRLPLAPLVLRKRPDWRARLTPHRN